ncbi:MAG: uracil-DNA glycosylase family protein [Ignavibacteriaceae bacterium]
MDKTFGRRAANFYINLKKPFNIPDNIEIINPYEDNNVKKTVKKFYKKFFNDNEKRLFIFGINPGRFGGGITGINFTDPVALREYCGIDNNLGNRRELSSQFVYEFISAFGGAEKFYKKFFISAIFPLAILNDGKNFNFYDDKKIYRYLKPVIVSYMKKQVEFGAKEDLAISLGKKNFAYLKELNDEIKYFKKIEFLEHPRFIMQYRRKQLEYFIRKYLKLLHLAEEF